MKITTFETAKVGDRVWSITKGWGEIIRIDGGYGYPIEVKYDSTGYDTFTFGGYSLKTHVTRSLFWDEIVIDAPVKPMPDLVVDTKVLVWNDPSDKHNRHFSHFGAGCIWTFKYGCTSFTSEHISATTAWGNWELAE